MLSNLDLISKRISSGIFVSVLYVRYWSKSSGLDVCEGTNNLSLSGLVLHHHYLPAESHCRCEALNLKTSSDFMSFLLPCAEETSAEPCVAM